MTCVSTTTATTIPQRQCNRLMGRLGTIFTTMPVTRPPVAMLYSLSDVIAAQAADRSVLYAHAMPQGERLPFTYLAGKLIQRQFLPIVDEDVVDGTLAAHHKAVILTAIRHLDPAVTAALEDFAAEGKAVYDALEGGPAKAKDRYEFGKGELRVFALTARPIAGVAVATPVVHRDLTQPTPITLRIAATVLDDRGGLLCGSVPLRIRVLDPKGTARYDLHRATKQGVLSLELPLAANDPAGDWSVIVTELLDNKEGTAPFAYRPAATCGATAGLTRRGIMLGGEQANLFRFARVNHAVTIVKGSADFHGPAAATWRGSGT